MVQTLSLIGRETPLFIADINDNAKALNRMVEKSSFLVLGGAGSVGQAVVKEIFRRQPQKLHVVDLSENNLVELVRDLRSTFGYIPGEFKTFALDIDSKEYDAFFNADGNYHFVLNLSALKHVRSEKDPYSLMRLLQVNIFNTEKTLQQCIAKGVQKYFCVSTDKAAGPINLMGASKRIMELVLLQQSANIPISTARFANVAFSDGSLLHGFKQRLAKNQAIAAPTDVQRFFLSTQESGELCLMACIFGENRDIFFPKPGAALKALTFTEIAYRFLRYHGYTPHNCSSEQEARALAKILPAQGKWPCLNTLSDTTGEKPIEEFYTDKEIVDLNRFNDIGVIKNRAEKTANLSSFSSGIQSLRESGAWTKSQIITLITTVLPEFHHVEKDKNLDDKM